MSILVTKQLTEAGRRIEQDSFAIVDQEAGSHPYSQEQWPVVQRMIHATADFEFNGLTEFHPQAVAAGIKAVLVGSSIVTDVEMIRVGISRPRLAHFGVDVFQFIDDQEVIAKARAEKTTRAVQAMGKAHELGLLNGGIVAIGNAPTALLEVIRLICEQGVQPALVIGMPVGFVSAEESKALLTELDHIPWIITRGRKGGSTLVVATLHALLGLADNSS